MAFVAAWPGIVVPTTEFGPPSHQSQIDCPAPASVALWIAAMPPPFWTNLMIAFFCGSSSSGPGRLPPANFQDMLSITTAS